MAFLEGIAGYVERKGSKKRRHKTESGQRHSLNGLMTDLGSIQGQIHAGFVPNQGQIHVVFVSNQGHTPANLITARDLQNNSPSA